MLPGTRNGRGVNAVLGVAGDAEPLQPDRPNARRPDAKKETKATVRFMV